MVNTNLRLRHPGPSAPDRRSHAPARDPGRLTQPSHGFERSDSFATLAPRARSVVRMQRLAGNAATARRVSAIQRTPPSLVIQREVVGIGGGEQLIIDDGLAKDARRAKIAEGKAILKEIKNTYGVTISSKASVKAILKDYFPGQRAPKSIRKAIQPVPWHIDELRNVRDALQHYAPILGLLRKQSKDPLISGSKQGITTLGKVGKALSPDDSEPYGVEVETDTMGETFTSSKNVTFFQALGGKSYNFAGDTNRQQRGTMAHEMSHALIQPQHLGSWVTTFKDYWRDEDTRIANDERVSTATPPAEAPITRYGATNAAEDLAETAKFFFEAPARLKGGDGQPKGTPGNAAPRRYDAFHRIVLSWTMPSEKVSMTRFQELATDFLALASTDLVEIVEAYERVRTEFESLSDEDKKKYRSMRSQCGDQYVTLAMNSI